MKPEPSFWEEEIRCGYRVSAAMKQVWGVQLELLAELQRVCREYGLRYFASGGTLLGAVRHRGYIPWDDDIDLVMFRADYDRLCAIGAGAFRPPYFFQSPATDRRYARGHIQLRKDGTAAILPEEGPRFPFHQGIFVDIFPLDGVPENPRAFRAQRRRLIACDRLLNATVRYPAHPHKTLLTDLAHIAASAVPYRLLLAGLERTAARYSTPAARRVATLTFQPRLEPFLYPAEAYETALTVPFEYTTLEIPAGYDRLLRIQYGDYETPRRDSSYHGRMLLDAATDYRDCFARLPATE